MRVCIIKNADAEKISDVFRIANSLIDDGHECVILSRNRCSNSNKIIKKSIVLNEKKVDIYEISIKSEIGGGIKNIQNLCKYIKKVTKWLIENRDLYDVVHAFDLDCGLSALKAYRKTKKDYVYHIADFYVDSRRGIPKFLETLIKKIEFKVINNANTTIICTEQRIEQIKGSKPKKLVVVHNSPAINYSSMVEENIDKPIKIAYVGGLSEDRFIREMIDIVKEDNRFELFLAGNGPLRDYVEKNCEEFSNITYFGEVPYKNSLEIYKKCDIIFAIYNHKIKNHQYSAPNKFYEAMMLSKAIIVCQGTGVDKLVEMENIGCVCEYNKNSVKNIIKDIDNDRRKLLDYKINSNKAYKHYSYKEMSKRIKDIYKILG